MDKVIRVVGAVFLKEGKFLAFRKKPGKSMAGYWEFPGGKIEPGETAEQALRREISEELGVDAQVGAKVTTTLHEYDFATVELTTFECVAETEDFRLTDHDKVRWVDAESTDDVQWAPADIPAVEILCQRRGERANNGE